MIDLLLPTTGAGVIAQGVVAAGLIGLGIWHTGAHRDRRILVVGLALLITAGLGLRALH
ncbi:MAG: hypothetical protein JJE47_06175 [Acidimicrobiia bacterium]|nr:hypothetical protein [Acidimicrobiia bacterium]